MPCPPPGDLPDPGIEPRSLLCRWILDHLSHQGRPLGKLKNHTSDGIVNKERSYIKGTILSLSDFFLKEFAINSEVEIYTT